MERLYHLYIGNVRVTGYPMPHAQCVINKSKFSNPNRIIFVEVK